MKSRATGECRILLERLSAFLDGDLSARACTAIERHSRTCRRCAAAIDDLRRTTGLCRRAATVPLPDAIRRRAQARLRTVIGEGAPIRTRK
jgi:anti-sigma factor RsiW